MIRNAVERNFRIVSKSVRRKPLAMLRFIGSYLQVLALNRRPFRFLDIAVTYRCNLKCSHCSAIKMFRRESEEMTVDDYRRFAKQVKNVGCHVLHFTGGEPLVRQDIEDIIKAFSPNRYMISIQSNGLLAKPEKLAQLKRVGLDMICFSVDSAIPEEHDRFRNRKGVFQATLEGLEAAKSLGLHTAVSICVSHSSLYSDGFNEMIKLVKKLDVEGYLNLAVPIGEWAENWDVMIQPDDRKYIDELIRQNPFLRTDFQSTWVERGCSALKEKAYVTPYGDILPCPFIQQSQGNIFQEELSEILKKSTKRPPFNQYPHKCIAAEDVEYVKSLRCYYNDCDILPVSYEGEKD